MSDGMWPIYPPADAGSWILTDAVLSVLHHAICRLLLISALVCKRYCV